MSIAKEERQDDERIAIDLLRRLLAEDDRFLFVYLRRKREKRESLVGIMHVRKRSKKQKSRQKYRYSMSSAKIMTAMILRLNIQTSDGDIVFRVVYSISFFGSIKMLNRQIYLTY